MEERKKKEIEFHNKIRFVEGDEGVSETRWSPKMESTIKENALWRNMAYYSIERKSREHIIRLFSVYAPGSQVLDMCCGNGDDSFVISSLGAASVVGCDISDVSLMNCNSRKDREGGHDNLSFMFMDAEDMSFEDNSFDLITEYGALHHVDLPKTFSEIQRVLRPGGICICNETFGHNPIIHWYRKLTPELRTEFEADHILKKKDIELAKRYFKRVKVDYYHLFTLLAVPFRNAKFFGPMLSILEAIDSVVLKIPVVRLLAWQIVIQIEN